MNHFETTSPTAPGGRWAVASVCFLVLALAFSMNALPVTLMFSWSRQFDMPMAALGPTSTAINMAGLFGMALIAPFAGRLADRKGARFVLSLGMGLTALGGALFAAVDESPTQAAGIAGLFFMVAGVGVIGHQAAVAAIARRFAPRMGLATGIAVSGAIVGGPVVASLFVSVSPFADWRWTFGAAALACLASIPCIRMAIPTFTARTGAEDAKATGFGEDLASILKRPAFYLLFLSLSICGFTLGGSVETALVQMAAGEGFDGDRIQDIFSLLLLASVVGTVGAGWLADWVSRPLLLGAIYFLKALAFAWLLSLSEISGSALNIAAILHGAPALAALPVTAGLAASHFGLRVIGLAMGLLTSGFALGAAAGALLSLYRAAQPGEYGSFWMLTLCLAAVAGAMAIFSGVRRPATG